MSSSFSKYGLWLTPIALFALLAFGFGFNGLYGQDSHEYLRFAKAWKMSGFAPDLVQEFQWPVGFPLGGILLSYVGLPMMWSLNIVSLLAAIGTLVMTSKLIEQLYDGKTGYLWLILGGASQVYFIRGGVLVMSDMLCAFFVVSTYYHLVRYRAKKQTLAILLMLISAAAAFFTRYASVPLLIPPVVAGAFVLFRSGSKALKVSGVLFLTAILSLLVWSNNRFLALSGGLFHQWDIGNLLSLTVQNDDGSYVKTVPNVLYVFANFFHIGYLTMGIILIPFYKRCKPALKEKTLWIGLCLYLLVLVGLETQNYRFLILSHPLVLVVLFGAFDGLSDGLTKKGIRTIFLCGVLSFNAAFFYYSFSKTFAMHNAEKQVSNTLKEIDHDGLVYTFYVDQSFSSYGVNNKVENLYLERYDSFEKGALVIFNPVQFDQQWNGTKVMDNWQNLTTNYALDTLKKLDNNWTFYAIK